mgnify:CR=1 FL=1
MDLFKLVVEIFIKICYNTFIKSDEQEEYDGCFFRELMVGGNK